ncbi:MAG: hypothetical protein WA851_11610, partial [Xanthobacteraceae bacterium]
IVHPLDRLYKIRRDSVVNRPASPPKQRLLPVRERSAARKNSRSSGSGNVTRNILRIDAILGTLHLAAVWRGKRKSAFQS